MKHLRTNLSMVALAVSIVLSSNCSKNSPSGPTEDTEEATVATAAASVPTPTPVTTPVVVTSGCEEDATAVVKVLDFSASEGTMTAKNDGKCTNWVGLSAYRIPEGKPQELVSEDFKQLTPGATASFKVSLACGDNQVDASAGLKKSPGNGPNGVPNFARAFLPVPQFGGNLIYRSCITPTPTPPPTPPPTCAAYQGPTITGDIAMTVGVNQAVLDSGTVAPAGGTFNPGLPQTISRPNAGQSPASFSTTYTLAYGPTGLQCKTTRSFSKQIPPKEQTCEQQHPPQGNITGSSGDSTNFNGAASVANSGDWEMQIRATSTQAKCNANDADYIKTSTTASLQCGQSRSLTSSYHWAGHPSEWWWVALYRNGSLVTRSGCTQNTHN